MHFVYRRAIKTVAIIKVKQDIFNYLIKTKCLSLIKIKYFSPNRFFSDL